jgi:hypothetical protein
MTDTCRGRRETSLARQVEIRVRGRIDPDWTGWFRDLAISHVGEETVLSGVLTDQAALYGILSGLQDLGLSLMSVNSTADDDSTGAW